MSWPEPLVYSAVLCAEDAIIRAAQMDPIKVSVEEVNDNQKHSYLDIIDFLQIARGLLNHDG